MKGVLKNPSFSHSPRLLLVDDDPLFGHILTRVARAGNIQLTHTLSPRTMNTLEVRKSFDVMIIDYGLTNVTGVQLVRALENCEQSLPTVLVSSYKILPSKTLPASIVLILHKSEGPQKILHATLSLYEDAASIKSESKSRIDAELQKNKIKSNSYSRGGKR